MNEAGKKVVLLGVTGSIAAYKSCEMIRLFRHKGYEVRCVMSRDADKFITRLTLETLSGKEAFSDMFRMPDKRKPEHISLAEEADIILIAPATADIIAKTAAGLCDDLLSCVICAYKGPVVFAPAMNDNMFDNPIIQDKIEYLRNKGYYFVSPVKGPLACGKTGIGHLAPVETIVLETEKILAL
ncbi:MAG: flavoprotein [Candidatus Omnitrophica bacterium]|nr:flavoprotein [Candidatus Omnitrophota bacterium]MDD5488327.1 flavoprotein [Candidatus Omnitrophota bacterium]